MITAADPARNEAVTGVLVFASAAERYVEIIADASIHEKVSPEVWDDAIGVLTKAIKAETGRRLHRDDRTMQCCARNAFSAGRAATR